MMRHVLFFFVMFFLIVFPAQASQSNLSMDVREMPLVDAIRMLAKLMSVNVIVSPSVQGRTSLGFHAVRPADALEVLLASHGLGKWKISDTWLIAPQNELIQRKQTEMKWQKAKEAVAPLQTRFWEIRYTKAEDIANLIQDRQSAFLSKRGRVRFDKRTNMLCVQDMTERIKLVEQLVARLDVPVQQILIEARLVSLDHDAEQTLGLRFNAGVKGPSTLQDAEQHKAGIIKLADNSLLDVKLLALEKAGHAELVSSPVLFAANQQSASIEAGEEVPYQEVSEGGGTGVAFKKAVLGLKVTPQVLPGEQILLQLQINQDRPGSKQVMGMPTISTRQIMTNVLVKNGQTIVLGGIYETHAENGREGIPLLSRLPVFDILFGRKHSRENRRELLIFVTPKIVTHDEEEK